MTITDEIKKLLTIEVLGECWHERRTEDVGKKPWDLSHCVKCGELVKLQSFDRRTYDNRNDLMDLYAVIEKAGRWRNFEGETFDYWDEERIHDTTNSAFTAWLFCLDGEDYESRCCLVAQWFMEVKK